MTWQPEDKLVSMWPLVKVDARIDQRRTCAQDGGSAHMDHSCESAAFTQFFVRVWNHFRLFRASLNSHDGYRCCRKKSTNTKNKKDARFLPLRIQNNAAP